MKQASTERVYVDSDAINLIEYNSATKELSIKFIRGGVYRYKGVPKKVFEDFAKTRSKGEYFNRLIRNKYSYSS